MYTRWLFLSLLTILFSSYVIVQSRAFLFRPSLVVFSPRLVHVKGINEVKLRGKADPVSQVEINGEAISLDREGNFAQTVRVSPGVSRILISAKNRFGKEQDITITVVKDQ